MASSAAANLRSGFLWNSGLNLVREILQFGTMLVLVRRLDPSAYGEFGLVSSIVGFFTVISFRAFLEQTLQMSSDKQPDYQNIFTFGGIIQGSIFALANLTAVGLRFTPKYSPVAPLLHCMSLLFLLDWLNELRVKMLERELDWARLRTLQAIGVVLNSGGALVLAWAGAGAYALLVPGLLVTLPTIYDLLIRAQWRPTWKLSWADFQPAFCYGLARMGSGAVQTGRQLAESAMLVQFLGFDGSGVYGRAVGLATIACLRFPSYLTLTLYPVLSRVGPGGESGRKASVLVLQSILWTIIPVAAVLAVLAGPVIHILYGDKWLSALPLLPLALVVTGLTALSQTLTVLLLVNLRERQCLYAELISTIGVLLALTLLLPHGVERYLVGVAVALSVGVAAMVWWLHRAGGVDIARLFRIVLAPMATASLLVAGLRAGSLPTLPLSMPIIQMAAFFIAFVGVYLLALRIVVPRSLAELVAYCPGRNGLRRWLRLPA